MCGLLLNGPLCGTRCGSVKSISCGWSADGFVSVLVPQIIFKIIKQRLLQKLGVLCKHVSSSGSVLSLC